MNLRRLFVGGTGFLLIAALHSLALAQRGPDYHDTTRYTTDLNHKGWAGKGQGDRIQWVPIKAGCEECQHLADEYNELADELLAVRHAKHIVNYDNQRLAQGITKRTNDMREHAMGSKALGSLLEFSSSIESTLKNLRRDEDILMAKLKRLGKELSDCNARCPDTRSVVDDLQDPRPLVRVSNPYDPPFADVKPDELKELTLPFPWSGPYPEVCFRCAKLAQRLNILRILTLKAQFESERRKRIAERERLGLELFERAETLRAALYILMLEPFGGGTAAWVSSGYGRADDVDRYTRNFHETLKLYQDCIKTCPKPGEKHAYLLSDPIRMPAPKVSAGQAADSVAQGIVGGMMGGMMGGIAGGGRKQQAPPLVSRPSHPEQKLTSKDGKTTIRLAGAIMGNGCQLTLGVDASPGNGAPHLIALQDGNGSTLMPSKIAVYQIWEVRGEWTLTVSWTKNYYQDGQLVKQEKGGWTASWTELLGQYKTPGELPAIWKDFGGRPFDGVRGVVADFAFPEGQSFNPADWSFVAHIATKDGDSIVTQPFVASMKAGEKGAFSFTQHERTVWEARGR